ncbi:MAG: YitT family protein [Thermoflavifilum sp.]|nr:YitT family protein [Thermoflavifilum sp.]MCL6513043.1 YitT family protein [Alicyclobacillus sp.]
MLYQNQRSFAGFLLRILLILAGTFVGSIAVNEFMTPAHILAGGVTGIAQLMGHFTGIGMGTLYFLLNIPLFLLGYRFLGRRFIALTGVGILSFSVFTDVVRIRNLALPQDPLLLSIYAGVLLGISSSIVFRAGGSTGGTDILSLVLNRLTGKSVGGISFALNVVVVLLSMGFFGVDAGLYTLVALFASARVVNSLLHFQHRKTVLIVSSKATEISRRIGERLGRGSTLVAASGAYTGHATSVLMCVLTHLEVPELRELALEVDPQAFITVLDTTEVVGKFRQPVL